MKHLQRKIDTVMLAVALFSISGAILAYNLHVVGGGEIAVSLSELAAYSSPKASAISEYSAANLNSRDSVFTASVPSSPPRSYELLDPIIVAPAE